ncbi:MAG: hypothetical protein E7665_03015 [Ruminococcaceae bacterium]|nr:hypothetical protein [Oscillospiraceae bacterium]
MLTDTDIVSKIAELKAKDESLWEKIRDFFIDLADRIKAAYENLAPLIVRTTNITITIQLMTI